MTGIGDKKGFFSTGFFNYLIIIYFFYNPVAKPIPPKRLKLKLWTPKFQLSISIIGFF